MATKAWDTLYSLEREVVTLFGNCVGAGYADAVQINYVNLADYTAQFEVGDSVTEATSLATGTVVSNTYSYATITFENLADERFPFEVGETVTEGTTGYTAIVTAVDVDVEAGTGTLTLGSMSTDFTGSETLTGGTSGALADGLVYSGDSGVILMTVDSGTFTGGEVLSVTAGASATGVQADQGNYFYDPTSVKGAGIASITGAGFVLDDDDLESTYTITFDNKWAGLLGFNATVMDATSPDDWEVVVTGQPTSVKTGTLVIKTFKGGDGREGGALTSDDKLYFEVVLSNAKGGTPGDLAGYSETTLA